jgi:hypothetical protein
MDANSVLLPTSTDPSLPTDPANVAGVGAQPQPVGTSEINTTKSPPLDAANAPYKFYKDPGNSLWLNIIVANPLAVSATVTDPLGNVSQISDIANVSGIFTLKFNLPVDAPSGTYVLFISVTKGPSTSTTQVSVTESGQKSVLLPGLVP